MNKTPVYRAVKKFLSLIFMLIIILSLMTGCVNSNDLVDVTENTTPLTEIEPFADFNIDDELIGIWQYELTHFDRFLIFGVDGTGAERRGHARPRYRTFAWTTENGYLITDGELRGKFSYVVTDSIRGVTLTLTNVDHGSTTYFYCVYTSYARCCCVAIAYDIFFGNMIIRFKWEFLLIGLGMIVGGFMFIALITRSCTYYHAFYGMSKTRRRKIVKAMRAQSRFNYIFMPYLMKYNYPKMTKFCLLLYWLHLASSIFVACSFLIFAFIEITLPPLRGIPTLIIFSSFIVIPMIHFFLARIFPIRKGKNHRDILDIGFW